jgi:hypothetical protein
MGRLFYTFYTFYTLVLGEPPRALPLVVARAVGLSASSPSRLRFACRFGGSATIPLARLPSASRSGRTNKG